MSETDAPRKLDVEVAWRVFSARTSWIGEPAVPVFCSSIDANEERFRRGKSGIGYPGDGDVPHYTTAIEDAWLVVEKMAERGWDLSLDTVTGTGEQAWLACFATGGSKACRSAATAPEAICRAALAALPASPEGGTP